MSTESAQSSHDAVRAPERAVPLLVRARQLRGRTPLPTPLPAPPPTIADVQAPGEVRRRDAVFRRSLALADVVAAACALTLALVVLGDDRLRPAAFVALPLVVIVSKVAGLYDRDELLLRKTTLDEAPAVFQVATLYTLLVWLGEGLFLVGRLGNTQVVGLWASLIAVTLACRVVARGSAQRGTSAERCVVVGDAHSAARVKGKLAGRDAGGAQLVGRVALDDDKTGTLGPLDDLAGILSRHGAHRVIIAAGAADSDDILELVSQVKALGVKVSLLPRIFEVVGSSVEFDDLGGMTVLGVRRFGLTKSSALVKRALDLTGAGLVLLATAPVLAVCALLVATTSKGPVLFRQTRIGRDGRPFEMLKLRTMVQDAESLKPALLALNEADGLFKMAADPRVTTVGRLLRKTSLDELPQLLNVLRGEMSLVGPRPLVAEEDDRIVGRHRRRLQLTPGMTGHWQILGASRVPLEEMVTIDYLYVANWSLWLDIKILLRTVPHVAGRRGL